MKKLLVILSLLFYFTSQAQEAVWDQGIPLCPDNNYITELSNKVDLARLRDSINSLDTWEIEICREIGLSFYDIGLKDEAEWYLSRSKEYHFTYQWNSMKVDTIYIMREEKLDAAQVESMQNDLAFLASIPKTTKNLTKSDLKELAKKIDSQIKKLIAEKDSLVAAEASQELIDSKNQTLNTLEKDKEIIDLQIETDDLKYQSESLKIKSLGLEIERRTFKKYLIGTGIAIVVLILIILIMSQRRAIRSKDVTIIDQLKDINKKNTYLEHAARIIRHDMHSGINTYIPRGISSLEKRLSESELKELKIDTSLKMIKEGLSHTQRVYKSVYEFTNLVKSDVNFETKKVSLNDVLESYLTNTSYKAQVKLNDLGQASVNEVLFCNAIDNLIRNGLKYNDSSDKQIKIFIDGDHLIVEDNGRGLDQKKFEKILSTREEEHGLGLNICQAILSQHGFELSCEKYNNGTKMKIKLK